MSVGWLWTIVGAVWFVLALELHFPHEAVLAGFVWCAVFARAGFLAGKHGVRR